MLASAETAQQAQRPNAALQGNGIRPRRVYQEDFDGLNDGMTITTDDGTEYELKIEGGGRPTERKDPTMGLVFDAMKAQFGVTDDD